MTQRRRCNSSFTESILSAHLLWNVNLPSVIKQESVSIESCLLDCFSEWVCSFLWSGRLLLCPDRAAQSIVMSVCVCLCVCLSFPIISLELRVRSSPKFLCMLAMAVARSSSGGVVICYVLPVIWMTPCLLISQACSTLLPSWSAVHMQPWAWL